MRHLKTINLKYLSCIHFVLRISKILQNLILFMYVHYIHLTWTTCDLQHRFMALDGSVISSFNIEIKL